MPRTSRLTALASVLAFAACGGSSSSTAGFDARAGVDAGSSAIDAASGGTGDARTVDAATRDAAAGGAPDAPLPSPDAPLPSPDAPLPAPDAPLPSPDAPLPSPDAAPSTPDAAPEPVETTAYRVSSLLLRDPHGFFLGCNDITDPPGLFNLSVNGTIDDNLNGDGNDDGRLDLSIVILLEPLSLEDGARTDAELVLADCTAPAAGTSCSATASSTRTAGTLTNQAAGTCLDVLAGTQSSDNADVYAAGYPPIGITSAGAEPCFVSDPQTLTIPVAGARITLEDARVAARYVDGGLTVGLLRGFISEADADATNLPLPIFGPTPISELLWGGTDNGCDVTPGDPTPGDMDVGPDGETLGWYFYLNFTAETVGYQEL